MLCWNFEPLPTGCILYVLLPQCGREEVYPRCSEDIYNECIYRRSSSSSRYDAKHRSIKTENSHLDFQKVKVVSNHDKRLRFMTYHHKQKGSGLFDHVKAEQNIYKFGGRFHRKRKEKVKTHYSTTVPYLTLRECKDSDMISDFEQNCARSYMQHTLNSMWFLSLFRYSVSLPPVCKKEQNDTPVTSARHLLMTKTSTRS